MPFLPPPDEDRLAGGESFIDHFISLKFNVRHSALTAGSSTTAYALLFLPASCDVLALI